MGAILKTSAALAGAALVLAMPGLARADHGVSEAVLAGGSMGAPKPVLAPSAAAPSGGVLSAAPKRTPGSLRLVGHEPLLDRGMNAALAVRGDYAYVGSRTDGTHLDSGVLTVDVSDPAAPRVVGQIGPPNEGNPGETSRELRIWPQKELLMVLNHGCSVLLHRCAGGEAAVTSTIRFYDISGRNAAAPKLVSTFLPSRSGAQIPHEFFLWQDPKDPGRALIYYTNPNATDQELIVTDISGAREGKFKEIDEFKVGHPGEREGQPAALAGGLQRRHARLPRTPGRRVPGGRHERLRGEQERARRCAWSLRSRTASSGPTRGPTAR